MTIASAILEAGGAHTTSPGSHTAGDPMSQPETFLTAIGMGSNSVKLSEILETVKVIDEGDAQSWYTAWKATADLAVALAEDTQGSRRTARASTSTAGLISERTDRQAVLGTGRDALTTIRQPF